MTPPKVAIITRTKNRPLLLRRCVESVLNQTFGDWLHVIINDGGDAAAVEELTDRFAQRYQGRLKIIHNQTSIGMQPASNAAIRASESEYVTIHDDDDSWHSSFLEECAGYLDAAGPEATEQGVAAQSWWILEEMDPSGNAVEKSRCDYLPFETVGLFAMASHNLFPPIAFLYRRRAHEVIGYFEPQFNELGDYDFNLRFLSRFDIGVIDKKLAGYHWRHQSGGTSYANTVTDGLAAHRQQMVRLQNHHLRRDMAEQQMGLGFLMNAAAQANRQMDKLKELEAIQHGINRLTRKFIGYEDLLNNLFTPWKGKSYARRIYDHVTDRLPAAHGHAHGNGKPSITLAAEAKRAKLVSMDVFDTALLRMVRKPTDVFLLMQAEVRRWLKQPEFDFVADRIDSEEAARQQRPGGEVTLEEIYAKLREQLGCDEATASRIRQLELQTEEAVVYANPEIAKVVNGLKNVVYASDMYLPGTFISSLLMKNGLKEAPLYVSAELRASKHEGGLFDHLVKSVDVSAENILHVGDNAHSDVTRAEARGLRARHWQPAAAQVPLVDQYTSQSAVWNGDLASSLYTGLVRRCRLAQPLPHVEDRRFWEMLGYEVMGPLHHALLTWVIGRARGQGLNKLFFLARDGYGLAREFELFQKKFHLDIAAEYTFASRRLWNLAGIHALNDENLNFLVTPNPRMRVRDFFARIDIDVPSGAEAARFGFTGLDERVTTDNGVFVSEERHQAMRRLMSSREEQILKLAMRDRKTLVAYFREIGLVEDRVGVVDLGWHASSVKSLQQLLALEGTPRKIPGFYFGLWKHAVPAVAAGCQVEAMFMSFDEPRHRRRLLAESVELLEFFFSAPHPTIVGLEQKNGRWSPRYGEVELDQAMLANMATASGAARQFIRDALAICPLEVAPPFAYLETVLERLLRYPTFDEAKALATISWRNTFGGRGPLRRLALTPTTWGRITRHDTLQLAYDGCYWKRGFLAQLGPNAKKYVYAPLDNS